MSKRNHLAVGTRVSFGSGTRSRTGTGNWPSNLALALALALALTLQFGFSIRELVPKAQWNFSLLNVSVIFFIFTSFTLMCNGS